MRVTLCLLVGVLALLRTSSTGAQTDALVVNPDGSVGVGIVLPTETVNVVAALEAPFVEPPPQCQLNVPVRILILAAETLETLVSEQAVLSDTSRVLKAELPASGGERRTIQVAVLTRQSVVDCLAAETTAVGELGEIRKLSH